jgi:hypothetical protein
MEIKLPTGYENKEIEEKILIYAKLLIERTELKKYEITAEELTAINSKKDEVIIVTAEAKAL